MNNSQIVEKLKGEHRKIVDILEEAHKGNGMAANVWKDALIEAKRLFMNHLDHEDETIYNDTFFNEGRFGGYGATAKKFQAEMKDITLSVENFFKKYRDTTNGSDFNRDYAALVNDLKKRINAEEMVLFKQFEEING
jgi:hypothetical protein